MAAQRAAPAHSSISVLDPGSKAGEIRPGLRDELPAALQAGGFAGRWQCHAALRQGARATPWSLPAKPAADGADAVQAVENVQYKKAQGWICCWMSPATAGELRRMTLGWDFC